MNLSEKDFEELRVKLPVMFDNMKTLVDARLLHQSIEAKEVFAKWINRNIESLSLIEDVDYFVIEYDYEGNTLPKDSGVYVAKREFHLTTDAAKQILMTLRSELGKKIRLYFIEVEKKFREMPVISYSAFVEGLVDKLGFDFRDEEDMLRYIFELRKENRLLASANETLKKSLNNRTGVTMSFIRAGYQDLDYYVMIDDAAKRLQAYGYDIGPRNFLKFLCDIHFLMRKDKGYEATRSAITRGYAVYKQTREKYFGKDFVFQRVFITSKGFETLVNNIKDKCKEEFLKYGKFLEKEPKEFKPIEKWDIDDLFE